LRSDAERLRKDIVKNPPADSTVSCYNVAYLPPARESLERLTQRLPLVEGLVAREGLHPEACRKIVAALRRDLEVLGSEQELRKLSEAERTRSAELRRTAMERIARIEKKLE
jgi:hypothetical protein